MKLMVTLMLAAGMLAAQDAKKEPPAPDVAKLAPAEQTALNEIQLRWFRARDAMQTAATEFNAKVAQVCAAHKMAACQVDLESGTVTKRAEAAKAEAKK